jgi:hypothetical protein
MLVNLIAVLSASGSAFTLLEFFLSKSAKERVSDYLIRGWFRLANIKGWSILPWLRRPRNRFLFSFAVVGCMAGGFYLLGIRESFLWVLMPVILVPVLFVGLEIVENIVEEGALFSLACTVLMCVAFGALAFLFPDAVAWRFFLSVSIFMMLFNLLAVLPMAVIRLTMYALKGCELMMRRMAEYEKGPVLACGLVLGTIAAAVKAFFG